MRRPAAPIIGAFCLCPIERAAGRGRRATCRVVRRAGGPPCAIYQPLPPTEGRGRRGRTTTWRPRPPTPAFPLVLGVYRHRACLAPYGALVPHPKCRDRLVTGNPINFRSSAREHAPSAVVATAASPYPQCRLGRARRRDQAAQPLITHGVPTRSAAMDRRYHTDFIRLRGISP